MNDAFPQTLSLYDQGKFMLGYYQQYQEFFVKNETKIADTEKTVSANNK